MRSGSLESLAGQDVRVDVRNEPVLIGPAAAGKSSVGRALAELLNIGFVDLDAVADTYYEEAGQPLDEFKARIESHGYPAAHRWWQPARLHALERVLDDHSECVFALGAGHTHYEDRSFSESASRILEPFRHVVRLLPARDPDAAVSVLRSRCAAVKGHDGVRDGVDFISIWVASDQNARLATATVCSAEPVMSIAADVRAACGQSRA